MYVQSEDLKLYEPVQFVYDGVIGPKKQHSYATYDCVHRFIVKPQAGYQMIDYVLFHTATTFNWLKTVYTVESCKLLKYLNSYASRQQHPLTNLVGQLKEYCDRWDVMKNSFMARFFINHADCRHLNKKIVWSIDYLCKGKKLYLSSHRCKECQRDVAVQEADLKQCPEYIVLKRREKDLSISGQSYELYLLISENKKELYVKVAGQWHHVGKEVRVVGYNKVFEQKSELYFYCRKRSGSQMQKPIAKMYKKRENFEKTESEFDTRTQFRPKKKYPKVYKISRPSQKVYKLCPLIEETYELYMYGRNDTYKQQVKNNYAKEKVKDEYDIEYDKGKVKKVRMKKINKKINFNDLYRKLKAGQNRYNYS